MVEITHQPSYSRVQLLLRMAVGPIYIMMPHGLVLLPLALVSMVLMPVAWGSILITGTYPKALFDFESNLLRWQMRVNARLLNLVDGYPAFGLHTMDPLVQVEIPYPAKLGRMHLVVKLLFGWAYCGIPHAVVLFIRALLGFVLMVLAFVTVLLAGSYPKAWHSYGVASMLHLLRVRLYMGGMTDEYPGFIG
jgi:hypothetical protein